MYVWTEETFWEIINLDRSGYLKEMRGADWKRRYQCNRKPGAPCAGHDTKLTDWLIYVRIINSYLRAHADKKFSLINSMIIFSKRFVATAAVLYVGIEVDLNAISIVARYPLNKIALGVVKDD